MRIQLKIRPVIKDLILTFCTEGLVLFSFFLTFRLISSGYGASVVGLYALVKRVVGLLYPVLLMGTGIGVARFVAMSEDDNQRRSYFLSGTVLVLSVMLPVLGIANAFKSSVASLFLGSVTYGYLVFPSSVLIAGLVIHSLVYSFLRGRLSTVRFNTMQMINLGAVPAIVILASRNEPIENIIYMIGLLTIAISFGFLLTFIKIVVQPRGSHSESQYFIKMMRYSVPRLPADFFLAGLMSIGPIVVARQVTIEEVGYLSLSQSLMRAAGAAVAPLGLIFLPKISGLIARNKGQLVDNNIGILIGAILHVSMFFLIQSEIIIDRLVIAWLGESFVSAIPIFRLTLYAMIFYVFYVIMRSVLDASKAKPLNTINLSISFILFLASIILLFMLKAFPPLYSACISFVLGFSALGLLTYKDVRKIYSGDIQADKLNVIKGLCLNIPLGVLTVLAVKLFKYTIPLLAIHESITLIVYLVMLWLVKANWIRSIRGMVVKSPSE